METCDGSPNSKEAIERKKTQMKTLLWKVCSCNLRARGGESSGSSVYLFSLSLCFFFTRTSLCQCQRDPMLSMCAPGSRRCRFVLVGPDRSPVCREGGGGEQHYCLVLSPSFTTEAQHQQSREAEFLTFCFPLSFFFLTLPTP